MNRCGRRTARTVGAFLGLMGALSPDSVALAQKTVLPVGLDIAITNRLEKENRTPMAARRAAEIKVVGPEVPFTAYPWQVGLLIAVNGRTWRCGGTLINEWFVLTAAHCLDALSEDDYSDIGRVRPASITVFQGDDRFGAGQKLALDNNWGTRIHHYWKSDRLKPMAYDAALLKLALPRYSAILVPLNVSAALPAAAIVSGWGRFDPNSGVSETLRANAVSIAENATCRGHLDPEMIPYVNETTLCTVDTKRDACSGDSGGPLVIGSRAQPQLVGVVSWGPPRKCSEPGQKGTLVGGYAWSRAIADWVIKETGDASLATTAPPDPLMPVDSRSEGEK